MTQAENVSEFVRHRPFERTLARVPVERRVEVDVGTRRDRTTDRDGGVVTESRFLGPTSPSNDDVGNGLVGGRKKKCR